MLCSICLATDYIRIDINSIVKGSDGVGFDYYTTRECPEPPKITVLRWVLRIRVSGFV